MNIKFSKLTAAGNDFVLIDNMQSTIDVCDYANIAKKLCNRRYSIGGDGLIFLEKSDCFDFKMKYFNSDGSYASMCGNGARSVAKFAYVFKISKSKKIIFETDAGTINAEILKNDNVKLSMYDPKDLKQNINIKIDNEDINIDFINTGVPHAVVFVDNVENIDILKIARNIRYNDLFFDVGGTNVNFVEVINHDTIKVRTYERGVEGETLACGTGIIASGILSVCKKFVDNPVNILARGGDKLRVSFEKTNNIIKNVVLEGPAIISFNGVVKI
jgi:diaminopimelate epimerase